MLGQIVSGQNRMVQEILHLDLHVENELTTVEEFPD